MIEAAYLVAALLFIFVHGPDQQEIEINVNEISSIRQPREAASEHIGEGVNCIIFMTNGKFIGTVESCREVVKKVAALESKPCPCPP
jgi:hypothetical protein